MSRQNDGTPPEKRFDGLDLETSTRLLRLGLAGSGRPVDELCDRLERADGHRWFHQLVDRGAGSLGRVSAAVGSGTASLADVTALKDESKARLGAAVDQDARLDGAAGYFLSIAAALVHHDTLISSHRARDLVSVFLDLAAVSPPPWDDVFARASSSCRSRSEEPGD